MIDQIWIVLNESKMSLAGVDWVDGRDTSETNKIQFKNASQPKRRVQAGSVRHSLHTSSDLLSEPLLPLSALQILERRWPLSPHLVEPTLNHLGLFPRHPLGLDLALRQTSVHFVRLKNQPYLYSAR
jgi:hypothetical protein